MDYLTILDHRWLILFPAPATPFSASRQLPPWPSPTYAVQPLSPEPIAIPLSSLLYSDSHCAYFLQHHVLTTGVRGSLARVDKDTIAAAEVAAWREIDRAKLFARHLGKAFAAFGPGENMDEGILENLAAACGLGLQPRPAAVDEPTTSPPLHDLTVKNADDVMVTTQEVDELSPCQDHPPVFA
ncbi:hypothetical protein IAU60_003501 [Kwoniella sp. DSM 27419]